LSDTAADVKRRWEVSERECREQFVELTLLQTQDFKPCHAIVSPPWVRNHLSEGMRLVALYHPKMVGELAAHRAEVSSTVESALGCSVDEIFQVEIVAEFQRLEEQHSRLLRPATRICNLLLGPPPGRA
jgi:hypothetical protein